MPALSGTARSRMTAWGGSRAIAGSFAGKVPNVTTAYAVVRDGIAQTYYTRDGIQHGNTVRVGVQHGNTVRDGVLYDGDG